MPQEKMVHLSVRIATKKWFSADLPKDAVFTFLTLSIKKNVSCSTNESLLHKTAKHIVATYPTYFKFQERCMECKQFLSSDVAYFEDAQIGTVEFRIGSYIVDVAIHDVKGQLTAIIEIRHTHAIESEKWTSLYEFTKFVFEVNASEIVEKFDPNLSSQIVGCVRKQVSFCDSCTEKRTETCQMCSTRTLKKLMHCCRKSWKYICTKCILTASICKECKSEVCAEGETLCRVCKFMIDGNIKQWEKSFTLLNTFRLQQVRERHNLAFSLSNNFVHFMLRPIGQN